MIPPDAPILTAARMRAVEEAAFAGGVAQADLMERAGLAVAQAVRRLAGGRAILVLAGPGNNGGDAYVAARHLAGWGHDVTVAAYGEAREGAALTKRARWTGRTVPLARAEPRPVVVDGLFGTGLSRRLADDVAAPFARLIAVAELTVAIDLPSGLGSDDAGDLGLPAPVDLTVALGALKPAHVLSPHVGNVLLDDLGIAIDKRWHTMARPVIAAPPPDAHKYRATVVVASGAMPGAARLAARGAAGAGGGYVMLAGSNLAPGPLDAIVHRGEPLADILAQRTDAVALVGPGLGRDDAARALLDAALASANPLVIDGDALTLLGRDAAARASGRSAPTVLTPHEGEFARMFDTGGSKIDATIAAAKASGATIVHKGHATVIATPDGAVTVSHGPSWLATAGTGDVLAGAIAARIADSGDAAEGAGQGVWLHAAAARRAGAAFTADDLPHHLPAALATCR